jgi:ribosome-binding factor A
MGNRRGYARTERVNELLREIIAEELTKEDDDDLAFVTITAVDVDRELERARVYYTTVDGDDDNPDVVAALERFRPRARRAVGQQARIRKTPDLEFTPDDVQRSAERIESIIKQLHTDDRD